MSHTTFVSLSKSSSEGPLSSTGATTYDSKSSTLWSAASSRSLLPGRKSSSILAAEGKYYFLTRWCGCCLPGSLFSRSGTDRQMHISDVLPWQCEVRYPESCRDVTFVDVDYPDLIQKKRQIVLETPELQGLLGTWEVSQDSPLLLKSQRYCQVGCDLRQLSTLQACLTSLFDMPNTEFLFVAEVSITYMDTEGADGVIKWASTLGHGTLSTLTPSSSQAFLTVCSRVLPP